MIDSQIRDLLAATLPGQPPAPPGLRESLLAAGRRAQRRQRVRQLTATVSLAVALGLTPLLVVGRGAAPEPAAPSIPSTAPSFAPSFAPSMTPAPSPDPSSDTRTRFGAVIQQNVRRLLPTATFTALDYMEGVRVSEPFEAVADPYGRYGAGADIKVGDRDGYVGVHFDPGAGNTPTCDGAPETCEERAGPRGEKIIFWTYVKLGVTNLTVELDAPGVGTFYGYCSNAGIKRPDTAPPPTGPPQLTGDQVIEILVALEPVVVR
jgi:hypothetical protein